MRFQAVLPSIYPLWTDRCVATMSDRFRSRLLVVDNTRDNRGVAGSWNLGIDRMGDADWLVIVSAATRFGPPGGDDFLDELDGDPGLAVEAGHGVGWHLIAFPRRVIETVGRFDPIFWPAYYEDEDYARRIALAYPEVGTGHWWRKTTDLDAAIAGFSHGVDRAGVTVDNPALQAAWVRKWGGPKGAETFDRPYGLAPLTFVGVP